ncbi:protein ALP1-like isoform X1, partial [Aphis craccivora]
LETDTGIIMYNQAISCSASNMQTDELQWLVPINRAGSNHYSSNAKEIRDKLKMYVNHAGALEYQQRQCKMGQSLMVL